MVNGNEGVHALAPFVVTAWRLAWVMVCANAGTAHNTQARLAQLAIGFNVIIISVQYWFKQALISGCARPGLTRSARWYYANHKKYYEKISITQYKNSMKNDSMRNEGTADPRVAFFNHHAPAWDQTGPDPAATLRRLRELNGQLGLRSGMDLLEIGCGTGQITGWLADTVKPGKVVAMDFSSAMLAQARARGVQAEFVCVDICLEGPVARQFDVVLCFHSFPHFRDPAAALRQIARYLRPGGMLLVVHLVGSSQLNAFHQKVGGAVGHDCLPPAAQWPELLRPAGINVIDSKDREDLFLLKAGKI